MEESKEKLKEEKTKKDYTVWFIILIGVLVIMLVCAFVYIWKMNNRIQDETIKLGENSNLNVTNEDLSNYQGVGDQYENLETDEEDKDAVEVVGLETKYKELSKAAIKKIEIGKDFSKSKEFEYDLDKSIKTNNVKIKIIEDEKVQIIYNSKKTEYYTYDRDQLFIVDLDKQDNYLDILTYQFGDSADTTYTVLKNNGKSLKKINYSIDKMVIGEDRFYLDGNNNFFLQGDNDAYLDKVITKEYYTIDNTKAIMNKVDINQIMNEEYQIKENGAYFSKNKNKCFIEYNPDKKLKKGTKLEILGWDTCQNVIDIMKVKLEDGTVGYLWCPYS